MDNTTNGRRGKNKPVSFHIFVFPFKWEKTGGDQNLECRTRVCHFDFLEANGWNNKKFTTNSTHTFNEYNYFYDFVREIMYDVGSELKSPHSHSGEVIRHYEFEHLKKYYIKVHDRAQPYQLDIDGIYLNIYNTGTGVLSFHLANFDYEDEMDILKINQFGRRIHVPFFFNNAKGIPIGENKFETDFEGGLVSVQEKELAQAIWLSDKTDDFKNKGLYYENFSAYHHAEKLKSEPFRLPAFIAHLFGDKITTKDPAKYKSADADIFLSQVVDDRMFVICWYGNQKLSDELKNVQGHKIKNPVSEWWYKYIFTDVNDVTYQDAASFHDYLSANSYSRWSGYGTFYGMSRYSFVCLTDEGHIGAFILRDYVRSMYYKMIELVLVQRASILKFSDEITHLSTFKEPEKLAGDVSILYKQYIRFVNKIHFREVTAQDQGIEIYDKLHDIMNIKRDVEELDKEIEELHNYVVMQEEQKRTAAEIKRNERLELLTNIGAIFFLPSLITGFLGMNIFNDDLQPTGMWVLLLIFTFIVIVSWLSLKIINAQTKESNAAKNDKRRFIFGFEKNAIAIILLACTVAVMLLGICRPRQIQEKTIDSNSEIIFPKDAKFFYLNGKDTVPVPLDKIIIKEEGTLKDKN